MLLTSLLNRTLIKTKIFTFFSPSSTAISIYWNGTEVPPCAPAGGGGESAHPRHLHPAQPPGGPPAAPRSQAPASPPFPNAGTWRMRLRHLGGENQNQNHARADRLSARMRVVTRGDAGARTCSSSSEKTGRTGVRAGGGLQGGRSPRVARVGQEKSCLWQWPFSIKILGVYTKSSLGQMCMCYAMVHKSF